MSRHKKKNEKGGSTEKIQFTSRVEKEYLKPSYTASIGEELEDGLFDGTYKNSLYSQIAYDIERTEYKLFHMDKHVYVVPRTKRA